MAAGSDVAVLPPEIWAASVALFSQDLSAPGPVLSCGAEWVALGEEPWCVPAAPQE